jgi:hypothetical protein
MNIVKVEQVDDKHCHVTIKCEYNKINFVLLVPEEMDITVQKELNERIKDIIEDVTNEPMLRPKKRKIVFEK